MPHSIPPFPLPRFPFGRRSARAASLGLMLAGILYFGLDSSPAWPCSTFLAQHAGQPVFGRNYDWKDGAALVVINPAGLAKRALVLDPQSQPASWEAKYASVTFNQYGIELPTGGMNEKGLVVELMWQDSQYPVDERPVVNELQWIQYALDQAATVDELVAAMQHIRPVQAYAQVHYLACDASSRCAVFEYLQGRLVVTTGADLLVPSLTNDTYAASLTYLRGFQGFGGVKPMPTSSGSLDRFVRASMLANQVTDTTVPTSAFSILDSVAQGPFTQWRIVYVLRERTVYFRTQANANLRSVTLPSSGLDCPAKRKSIDIDADVEGDVSPRMQDYTSEMGRQLLDRSMAGIAEYLPPGAKDLLVAYADSVVCVKSVAVDGGMIDAGTPLPTDADRRGESDVALALADSATLATSPGADPPEAGPKEVASAKSDGDSSGCSCSVNGRQLQGGARLGLCLAVLALCGLRKRSR